jgi:pimeloyl-ACP methyl ester carboxylesterase
MTNSANVVTTALGVVETELDGSGTPVIVLHGSPGGIDAARAMRRFLPQNRFRTIALSRPGYLGTPLDPTDRSIDHEADLLASLLDTLGVDRAGVFAWSGGGPPAYRLAVRHPERVSSLVQVAALSSRWVAPTYSPSDRFMFGTRAGGWLVRFLARRAPSQIVGGALASEGSLRGDALKALTASVMADPEQRDAVLAVSATMSWHGRRKAGWDNDVANYAAIDTLALEHVRCPVLLIQGEADTDVTPGFSHAAHDALPDSTLVVMAQGTHLAFYAHPDAAKVQEQARRWLTDRNPRTGVSST